MIEAGIAIAMVLVPTIEEEIIVPVQYLMRFRVIGKSSAALQ